MVMLMMMLRIRMFIIVMMIMMMFTMIIIMLMMMMLIMMMMQEPLSKIKQIRRAVLRISTFADSYPGSFVFFFFQTAKLHSQILTT